MRVLQALSALLLPAALSAQTLPKALLWSVVHPDRPDTSFLYGTMHSTDDRAFRHEAVVQAVMPRCATVAGELDLSESQTASLALMGRMMLPAGQDLESLYSKKEWKRLEPVLKERLGPFVAMVGRMKPFFILATLMEGDMASDRERMLDDALMEHARSLDLRVIGLETIAEQMNALDAIPLAEQADMLYEQLLAPKGSEDLDAMHDAYADQDLERLWAITSSSTGPTVVMEKVLLTDRNRVMVHRMDSVIIADTTALFLLGAAHLPGPEGLLVGLRAKGYVVAPVVGGAPVIPTQQPLDRPRKSPHQE
jgi:uncharacterized protein YbaP (TraB family)